MDDIGDHLLSLSSSHSSSFAGSEAAKLIQEWERVVSVDRVLEGDSDAWVNEFELDQGPSVPSALDFNWAQRHAAPSSSTPQRTVPQTSLIDSLVAQLLSKPNIQPLLPTVSSTLLSSRSDDEISSELADILGYEELDLISSILQGGRYEIGKVIVGEQRVPAKSITPTPPHGKGKFKVKGKLQKDGHVDFTPEEAKRRMEESLRNAASRPLFSSDAVAHTPEVYPHVYASTAVGNIVSSTGGKFLLPLGTTRTQEEDHEEVIIPPARTIAPRLTERLIPISELDVLAKGAFHGYESLNRIQSIVFKTAYTTNENMLVCAPTGAGKTDVAMLSILRVIDLNLSTAKTSLSSTQLASSVRRDDFKIIYVAPMKALASEIVRKLGKRLAWLQIKVRELTGDMQLTRAEIAETQIIVTTPEKWDVVTRKPTGEGELALKVKLLIIDEVHLLNEERGAVIETIVARTLRQVESSQSVIRVVGLSATLPNYIDVADFLGASRKVGMFFFDASFRPIPLEQHFLGIKGKMNSPAARANMDNVVFDKVSELVKQGHQVMVFVHARKETVKSALALKDAAFAEGLRDEFSCEDHLRYSAFRREIGISRNKEMKQLFDDGFGIHHAGMLRSDRNMMERMFEARAIKVLCCTATLAWGVNLPAHAVIIKGTQVYDSTKGAFVDLSVLDVLQIFGRAGRPGLETSGVGYICTPEEKLNHYLDAITSQHPIESKFQAGLIDALNAEISLGTVATVTDGMQWLRFTYLFVRMRRNPFVYGMLHDDPATDPDLHEKRRDLVTAAAKSLADAGMILFNESTGALSITDLGNIAAKYYIRKSSIEIFNKEFKPRMSEADVLRLLSMSTEFDQIQVRENEVTELKGLLEQVPCDVQGGTDTNKGKVNILLQAYISRWIPEDFALVSDMAYCAQNGGRILRALMEIALSRKWATVSTSLMAMSKAVEKRKWPYDHPLTQFSNLSNDLLHNLCRWADDVPISELAAMSAADVGQLIHMNPTHGAALLRAAKQFPSVIFDYQLRPLSADLLRIVTTVYRAFEWNPKSEPHMEPFWFWVENEDAIQILQMTQLQFRRTTESITVEFVIPLATFQRPTAVRLRVISDRWIGAEDELRISLEDLVMPAHSGTHTPLIDQLPLLPLTALRNNPLQSLYPRIKSFNSIQTQSFWHLYNTNQNVLVCAPTTSGKTLLGEIAMWRTIQTSAADEWVLVVVPRRDSARKIARSFRKAGLGVDTILVPADITNGLKTAIRVVTTSALLHVVGGTALKDQLASLRLVVCDELETLEPESELAISLLRHATQTHSTRWVGLCASINDPADLAAWLGVHLDSLYSFRPSERDQALATSSRTFTIPQSAALFKAMAKPAHAAIASSPLDETAILFVPSRGQCKSVVADLVTLCALQAHDVDIRGFVGKEVTSEVMEPYLARLSDPSLLDGLTRGIGIFHSGLAQSDQSLVLELFAEGIIRVLVVSHEACWTLPVHAGLVVVMGTQYYRVVGGSSSTSQADRQLKSYSLRELVRMQSLAVRSLRSGRFLLLCQAEDRETYMRFLLEGLPMESSLHEEESVVLQQWVQRMRQGGAIVGKQDVVDVLSFTFLDKRLFTNPAYYDATVGGRNEALSRLVDRIWNDLPAAGTM